MTQEEHAQLIREEADGRVLFGVDRAFARRFFTDVPLRTIERDTGEATYLEKLVVFGAFIAAPICLLISAIFSVLYFRWWSVFIIPVTVTIWLLFSGTSSMGRSRLVGVSLLALAALALHVFGSFGKPWP